MSPEPTTQFASELAAEIDKQLRELAESYRPRLAELDAQVDEHRAALTKLRAERQEVERTLKRLEAPNVKPGPKQKLKPGSVQAAAAMRANEVRDQNKLANVRGYIAEHRDELAEGFTVLKLTELMKDANVHPPASAGKVAQYVEQLRAEGIVRADRVTRGGGMSYQLVSSDGATPDA